ncbi:MAG TPA: flavin reductase family protein [Pilimelia sp.]|nr:flavin reductase family protein [Pilimelia sp.]
MPTDRRGRRSPGSPAGAAPVRRKERHVDWEPGARIHADHPFAPPAQQRSAVRRLRGRLAAGVTLWTALRGADPVGLTVSSTVVADGEPPRLLGLVDEESALWEGLAGTRRFAVAVLCAGDRQAADRFAGLFPAPGGPFRYGTWEGTPYGPVPADRTWAGCRVDATRRYGWAQLVEATVEAVSVGAEAPPLVHYRGQYRGLGDR